MSVEVLERSETTGLRRQTLAVLAVMLVVGYCDQMSKAWAWRHADRLHVNSGGNMLVSPVVSAWLRDPVLGAGFDVAGAAVLGGAVVLLVRRRRPPLLLASLTLLLAGWISNLSDRLGLRYLVAPGGRRGVLDFMLFWNRLWNVADIAIMAGAALLVPGLVQAVLARQRAQAPVAEPPEVRDLLGSPRARRIVVISLSAVTLLAAVSAVTCGGVERPRLVVVQP